MVADLLSVDSSTLRSSVQPEKVGVQTVNTSFVQPQKIDRLSKEDTAFLIILGLFVNDPKTYLEIWDQVLEEHSTDENSKFLYKIVVSTYDPSVNPAQKSFFEHLRGVLESKTKQEELVHLLDKSSLLAEKTFEEMSPILVQEQLKSLLKLMQSRTSFSQRSRLAAKLRQAESVHDHEAVKQLMRELNELSLS